MKFISIIAAALLVASTSAIRIETLPDARAATPTEGDIAAHEAARA